MRDADEVCRAFAVSRETRDRLATLVGELERWQRIKNLVAPATLNDVWRRHVADSLQLFAAEPAAGAWLDLGSGAGFPGLVLAIAALERPGMTLHLVESNGRKSAFLRHVARLTGAPAAIHERRLEAMVPEFVGRSSVVTARALAPLADLLRWTAPVLQAGAIGLFPKGREVDAELTEAGKCWRFDAELIPSRTDSLARIVRIRSLEQR